MIRVLVADDHAVVRRGLIDILNDAPDIKAAGEAVSGRDVLQQVQTYPYDVLVLDLSMPGGGGLEVLRELRSAHPSLPVLILSVQPAEQYALRTIKAGAAGYLTKETAPEELVTAIRRIARGDRYITETVATELAAEIGREQQRAPHETLSDREFQVMMLLADGKTVSDIAEHLALSVKTISTYRSRLLNKLDLETTADIIRYAFKHELVE